MKSHITAVGVIQIAFGILNILSGLFLILAFSFIESFIPDPEVLKILSFITIPLEILLCFFGVLMVTGAFGLLAYKKWGRILTLIMGALGMLNIPIGTLKGVYIIWTLVQQETLELFEKDTRGYSPGEN